MPKDIVYILEYLDIDVRIRTHYLNFRINGIRFEVEFVVDDHTNLWANNDIETYSRHSYIFLDMLNYV